MIEIDKWRLSLGPRQDWVETSDENRIAEAARPEGTEINHRRRTKLTGHADLFNSGLAPYVSYSESLTRTGCRQPGQPVGAYRWPYELAVG